MQLGLKYMPWRTPLCPFETKSLQTQLKLHVNCKPFETEKAHPYLDLLLRHWKVDQAVAAQFLPIGQWGGNTHEPSGLNNT